MDRDRFPDPGSADRGPASARDPRRRPAAGAALPSTRDLARQLTVSRRVVVDAYAQLAAEGYLSLRQGARPRVSAAAVRSRRPTPRPAAPRPAPRARFDFRPSVPDLSAFPRAAWLRSLREALATITDADLGYGDPRGVEALRCALADYLGRVRGVVADPEHIIITNGYTQGLGLVCHALAAAGAKRIALEDPSNPRRPLIVARAGLEPVAIGVDEAGTQVDDLERADADAVVVDARPPAPDRRRAQRRAAHRPAGVAARARRDRDRGRLRRGVPLRPRCDRGAPGPRPRPGHLRRLGQQDPGAGAPDRLAGRAASRCSRPSPTRSSSPTGGPPASSSTRSPTS